MIALRIDPVPYLLKSGEPAVEYFTRRDLLDETAVNPPQMLQVPTVVKLLRGQHGDGSWGKAGGYPAHHRPMAETFKRLRVLVGRYELNRSHEAIANAAEFLFSTQARPGDFRGMLGDQYATYYTGEFAGLLIHAGYAEDRRVDAALQWLLSMRQNDGAWTIPMLTHTFSRNEQSALMGRPAKPVEPDRTQPFSHNWTDMVLRGFVAHPKWRKRPEIRRAAELLKSRFFKPDVNSSYENANYWVRFVQWWPNLLTSMESLAAIGLPAMDNDMRSALEWFRDHQQKDGSWRSSYFPGNTLNPKTEKSECPWLTLRIARVLKRITEGT